MIGIVGGIGPLAGVDLYKRITDQTMAANDQEHLPVLLASLPGEIADRTGFLLGGQPENPAEGLARVILMLEKAGARHIAMACNTAHAPAIFDRLVEILEEKGFHSNLLHLIDITVSAMQESGSEFRKVGVLVTAGAYQTDIYQTPLEAAGFEPVLLPFNRHCELVHDSIYRIKQEGENPTPKTIGQLNAAIRELRHMGAEAVILGCTEIGMVEKLLDFGDLAVYNPNTILAREMVRLLAPEKLKPQTEFAELAAK